MYKLLAPIVGIVLLTACASEISPDIYTTCSVGEPARTFSGTVRHCRCVGVNEHDKLEQNNLGLIGGGVAGGVAGNAIGKGKGNALATLGGAIAGAAAGAVAEKRLKQQTAMEYVVELDDGELMTVVQGPTPQLQEGQKVYVMMPYHGRARVVSQ